MTVDERAQARNKSSVLDVLKNEFDRTVKFSLKRRGYTHIWSKSKYWGRGGLEQRGGWS